MPHRYLLDVFAAVSHITVGLLAAILLEPVLHTQWYVKVIVVAVYVSIAFLVYRKIVDYQNRGEQAELAKWRRYGFLQSHVLSVTGEFLKERYKVNHELASQVNAHVNNGTMTTEKLQEVLEAFDKARREQIKSGLSSLSTFLPADDFARPEDPDVAVQDRVKVSFYAVETEPGTTEAFLCKKYRYYPNEAEPVTRRFRRGEGAAGKAWDTKRTVVCEKGGEDPDFKDMWDGGGQKEHYASMICIPAIEDIPAEKLSEVYGVLTVDTPTRKGYFEKKLAQFWADLFEPICNLLVYCHEAERVKIAFSKAVALLAGTDANHES